MVAWRLRSAVTMAVRETTLPHRVANSARGLAWSTLSGIENELNDAEAGKQAGGSSQIFRDPNRPGSETLRTRPQLSSRENSFRTQASASASKAAELDFDRFQEQREFQDICDPYELINRRASSLDLDYLQESSSAYNEATAPCRQRETITANDRTTDAGSQNLDTITSEASKTSSRSAAMRRLDQIGAHLQRNLSMQMTQQDIDIQSLSVPQTAPLDQQAAKVQSVSSGDQIPTERNVSELAEQAKRADNKPLHRQPEQPPQSSQDDEEDSPELNFHCPYYACHQNLLRLGSDFASANECVHAGCNFHPEGSDSWAAHVTMPHHNLQGSSATTER